MDDTRILHASLFTPGLNHCWGLPLILIGKPGTAKSALIVQKALEAGLPTRVHPHMLRHSYASHLLQSSGDLRAVQELLGHASISTTQVYTHLDFQHLARTYDSSHPRARRRG